MRRIAGDDPQVAKAECLTPTSGGLMARRFDFFTLRNGDTDHMKYHFAFEWWFHFMHRDCGAACGHGAVPRLGQGTRPNLRQTACRPSADCNNSQQVAHNSLRDVQTLS
jgi:hypothetical protein